MDNYSEIFDAYLLHSNRPGSHWYQHKYGKWQSQAVYAQGRPNPDAKVRGVKELTRTNAIKKQQDLKSAMDRSGIKCDSYNLDKFASDNSHNIVYITGYSGSGKSTLATELKSKDTNVINLDLFTEQVGKSSLRERDPEFVEYSKHNNKDFYKLNDPEKYGINKGTNEYGILLDDFENCLENFSREQYKKGKSVVVEGVQLLDSTFYPNKESLKGKPVIITKTNALNSFVRAGKRDDKLNLSDLTPSDVKDYFQWYLGMYKNIQNLDKIMRVMEN